MANAFLIHSLVRIVAYVSPERYWHLRMREKLPNARYYGYDVLETLVGIYLNIFPHFYSRWYHIEDLSVDKDDPDVILPGIDIRHFDSETTLYDTFSGFVGPSDQSLNYIIHNQLDW